MAVGKRSANAFDAARRQSAARVVTREHSVQRAFTPETPTVSAWWLSACARRRHQRCGVAAKSEGQTRPATLMPWALPLPNVRSVGSVFLAAGTAAPSGGPRGAMTCTSVRRHCRTCLPNAKACRRPRRQETCKRLVGRSVGSSGLTPPHARRRRNGPACLDPSSSARRSGRCPSAR